MTAPRLQFLGAAGTVTGSRFVIESGAGRAMVDAGLFQGLPELRRRNWDRMPIAPASIDGVVLSHAHLDHCGYLPRLVREGFSGPVVCTPETAQLAMIVLRDSAHLQVEEAEYANRSGYSKHSPALPLYDESDVLLAGRQLRPTDFHSPVEVAPGVTVTLRSAGHILGSASVLVDTGGTRTLFSGDLGRPNHALVTPREDPPAADTVVVESTYGDRFHPPAGGTVLADAVRRTIDRGGSVLIPAFAVDRTELVLLKIGELMRAGSIPVVPVHVDSPMALAALRVYAAALPEAAGRSAFGIPALHTAETAADSQALNRPSRPCIVISASGMATGGRVVHHLAQQLPDARNTVILTGYQAVGTRGRDLAEGAHDVKIHGRHVPVRAEVVVDDEFSVHADGDEIIEWLSRMPQPPRTVYLVHGEGHASQELASRIRAELDWCAVVPRYAERVRLD